MCNFFNARPLAPGECRSQNRTNELRQFPAMIKIATTECSICVIFALFNCILQPTGSS